MNIPAADSSALIRFEQVEADGLAYCYEAARFGGLDVMPLWGRMCAILGPVVIDAIGAFLDAIASAQTAAPEDRADVMKAATSSLATKLGGARAVVGLVLGVAGDPRLPVFVRDVLRNVTRNGHPLGNDGHFSMAYTADPMSPIMAAVQICWKNGFFTPPPMLRAWVETFAAAKDEPVATD